MAWEYLQREVTYSYTLPAIQHIRIDEARKLIHIMTSVNGRVAKEEMMSAIPKDGYTPIAQSSYEIITRSIRKKSQPDPKGPLLFDGREWRANDEARRRRMGKR